MTIFDYLLANIIVVIGSFLQAATGLGGGLIMVPLLILISFDFVPAPLLVSTLFLSALIFYKEQDALATEGLTIIIVELLFGSLIGGMMLYGMVFKDFVHLFGYVLIVAVLISLFGDQKKISLPIKVGASLLSGFMGTVAGVGAPLLALLFQFHEPKSIRATLSLLYMIAIVIMLSVLYGINQFHWYEFLLGLSLLPGIVIGWKLAPWVTPFINNKIARALILVFVMICAIYLLIKY